MLAWQLRLLPFVVGALSLLTLFACVANVVQVYEVERHIESSHDLELDKIIPGTPGVTLTASEHTLNPGISLFPLGFHAANDETRQRPESILW
jgi:hypothetical protein